MALLLHSHAYAVPAGFLLHHHRFVTLVLRDGGQLVKVRTKQLRAVDVVARVELLVCGVSTVVSPAHRQKQDIETEDVGKVQCDGNGPSLPDVVWWLAPDRFGGFVGRSVRVVLFLISVLAAAHRD